MEFAHDISVVVQDPLRARATTLRLRGDRAESGSHGRSPRSERGDRDDGGRDLLRDDPRATNGAVQRAALVSWARVLRARQNDNAHERLRRPPGLVLSDGSIVA